MKERICLFVGLLVFAATQLHAQTLQIDLDAPSLTWTTSGTAGSPGWIPQSTTSHDGVSATKTSLAPNTPNQTATLQNHRRPPRRWPRVTARI